MRGFHLRLTVLRWAAAATLALPFSLSVPSARADVPATYKGAPYKGVPQAIPGRVEFRDLDLGGQGVAWGADHNRKNSAGYQPLSGNDYRPDETDLPNLCKTNTNPPPDKWADGTPYPSAAAEHWYYMGYAHAHDWLRVTVNVQQAGTYAVSANWASAGGQMGLSIWFNDGHSPVDPTHPTDGVNKSGVVVLPGTSDYHIWKAYPRFATFDLSAGVQVMTFHLEKFDHLQYGFLQFDLVGGDESDGGAGAGAGGGGEVDAGTGTGGAAGATANGGAPGAGGSKESVASPAAPGAASTMSGGCGYSGDAGSNPDNSLAAVAGLCLASAFMLQRQRRRR